MFMSKRDDNLRPTRLISFPNPNRCTSTSSESSKDARLTLLEAKNENDSRKAFASLRAHPHLADLQNYSL